jgi:hypothetical protein
MTDALAGDALVDHYAAWVRGLADAMGLRDWTVTVKHDEHGKELDEDAYAQVVVTYGQQHAAITLSHDIMTATEDHKRWVVVHELVHCHTDQTMHVLVAMKDGLSPEVYRLAEATHRRACEQATDAIAKSWAKFLPMPPEPPA